MKNLISVKLRIVGVYFNNKVEIDPDEITTVKGVMDEYQRLHPDVKVPGGVRFEEAPYDLLPHRGVESLFKVIYNYPGKYNFFDDSLKTNGETLGGRIRKAGVLRLEEQKLPMTFEGVTVAAVWQYYVVGADGVNRSATKPLTGFQGYNALKNQYHPFKDGDTIIWRLVVLTLPLPEENSNEPFESLATAEISLH